MGTTLDIDEPADRAALHRKMDAEIARLVAETAKINAEARVFPLKVEAELAKLNVETAKLQAEARAYPWLPLATAIMGSTGVIGAVVAILIAFHR